MKEHACVAGLAGALLRIADDPPRVEAVHRLLTPFCHRARNRLNSIKLSLYLTRRHTSAADRDYWDAIEARYRAVEQYLEQYQTFFLPLSINPIEAPLDAFLAEHRAAWSSRLAERGWSIELLVPMGPVVGRFDPSRLGQGLDALVTSRADSCESPARIVVSVDRVGDRLELNWNEELVESTGRQRGSRARGTGLAIPQLARIVVAHGGSLQLAEGPNLSLRLSWPSAGLAGPIADPNGLTASAAAVYHATDRHCAGRSAAW